MKKYVTLLKNILLGISIFYSIYYVDQHYRDWLGYYPVIKTDVYDGHLQIHEELKYTRYYNRWS